MKEKNTPFSKFVLRTPSLPIMKLDEDCFALFKKNTLIRKAIFLASPDLYYSLLKYFNKEITDEKKKQRIINSYLKYLSRMSSRCTPFGLFAGCGVGEIGNKTDVKIEGCSSFGTNTRLDMDYLCELSIYLSNAPALKSFLKFYPNSSIYYLSNHIRYVEYKYVNGKRVHFAVSIENDEFLSEALKTSQKGAGINDLLRLFSIEDYSAEDIECYINDLIDNQVLICELEPSVCGEDYLSAMLGIIEQINQASEIFLKLKKVEKLLAEFDKDLEKNNLQILNEIEACLDYFPIKRKKKFLFQVDANVDVSNEMLDKAICNDILKAVNVLKKFTRTPSRTHIDDFKKNFYNRFEDRKVPLGKVFDVESGISYLQSHDGDISPLLDNLRIANAYKSNSKTEWEAIDYFLLRKLTSFISSDATEILIDERDIKQLPDNDLNLPNTFYAIAEIGKGKETENIVINLNTVGGSTGANLLGRFCNSNPDVKNLVKEIARKEEDLVKGKIVAEISHLPESRTGNVLLRPHIYKHEIPYLSNSTHPRQLNINELLVSVPSGQHIVLRENKEGKEVIPRLTTAHNYSNNSLPIYHFLCDLQFQNSVGGMQFSWGPLARDFNYLPRVRFKNLILSLAQWRIERKEILGLYEYIENDALLEGIRKFTLERKIKEKVVLVEGDNTLLIDFTQIQMVKVLLQTVKNRSSFILQEFFFHEHNSIVKGTVGEYTNQFIIPFFNHTEKSN